VDLAEHWRYANAVYYAGMEGLIDIQRWYLSRALIVPTL